MDEDLGRRITNQWIQYNRLIGISPVKAKETLLVLLDISDLESEGEQRVRYKWACRNYYCALSDALRQLSRATQENRNRGMGSYMKLRGAEEIKRDVIEELLTPKCSLSLKGCFSGGLPSLGKYGLGRK